MAEKKPSRKQQLTNALPKDMQFLYGPLIDNIVMLEGRLKKLKTKPFILINKKDPNKQKTTEAGRLFKNLQNEYILALSAYNKALGGEVQEETSPLREYLKNRCGSRDIETR